MRLSGYVVKEEAKAYIDALFTCEKLGIRETPITFCIDTGASGTCLSESEAIRFGIDLGTLKRAKPAHGVGGSVNSYFLEDVKIGFPINGHKAVVSFPMILIFAQNKSPIRRAVEIVKIVLSKLEGRPKGEEKALPNLLGFDFLKDCKISFSETEAYLDIEAS